MQFTEIGHGKQSVDLGNEHEETSGDKDTTGRLTGILPLLNISASSSEEVRLLTKYGKDCSRGQ